MKNSIRTPRRQTGLTLVELMVSLAIGLILLAGIGQVFVTNKRANQYSDGVSGRQENANFALEYLDEQLSSVAYIPNPQTFGTTVTEKTDMETQAFGAVLPLSGVDGGAGNDSLTVNMFPAPGAPMVDCLGIVTAVGDFVAPAGAGVTNTIDVRVGASGRTSLFCNGTEIVEGIDGMKVLYGVDTDTAGTPADGQVDRYLTWNQIAAADYYRIMTIRIALLVSSIKEVRTSASSQTTYTLLGQPITVSADRRIREIYETTIRLRNRCARLSSAVVGNSICA